MLSWQVSIQVVKSIRCTTFDDGTSYLTADLSINCDSDQYYRLLLFALGMFLLYPLGIPVIYLCAMCMNRRRICHRNEGRQLLMLSYAAAVPTGLDDCVVEEARTLLLAPSRKNLSVAEERELDELVSLCVARIRAFRGAGGQCLSGGCLRCCRRGKTAPGHAAQSSMHAVVAQKREGVPPGLAWCEPKAAQPFYIEFFVSKRETAFVRNLMDAWHARAYDTFWDRDLRDNDTGIAHLAFLFEGECVARSSRSSSWLSRALRLLTLFSAHVCADYEPRYWFWDVVEMVKKVLLACVALFLDTGSATQIVFSFIVISVASMLSLLIQPYLTKAQNMSYVLAQMSLWLAVLYGLLTHTDMSHESSYNNKAFDVVMATLPFFVIAIAIGGYIFIALEKLFMVYSRTYGVDVPSRILAKIPWWHKVLLILRRDMRDLAPFRVQQPQREGAGAGDGRVILLGSACDDDDARGAGAGELEAKRGSPDAAAAAKHAAEAQRLRVRTQPHKPPSPAHHASSDGPAPRGSIVFPGPDGAVAPMSPVAHRRGSSPTLESMEGDTLESPRPAPVSAVVRPPPQRPVVPAAAATPSRSTAAATPNRSAASAVSPTREVWLEL